MKIIILLALCFSAAFASQTPLAKSIKSFTVQNFHEHVVHKIAALKTHKNLPRLLENPPGLVEVVDQAVKSFEDVYEAVETVAEKLVQLIQENKMGDIIPPELPRILQKAGLAVHENGVYWVQFWDGYGQQWGLPPMAPEEVIDTYIGYGLGYAIIVFPRVTYDGIFEVINDINSNAAIEFEAIISEGIDKAKAAYREFEIVLEEAFENAEGN